MTPPSPVPPAPRRVLLFSGHLIDEPGRATPRFPAAQEGVAAQAIATVLDQLRAGPDDLVLTQGACGGDLLFTEACLQRGVRVQWLQPFDEAEFILRCVARCGEACRQRYLDARARLTAPPRSASREPGVQVDDPYERCNLGLLASALSHGPDKVHFICLWNGGGGDGPGGTAHMVEAVKRVSGKVTWIDTRVIFAA